jgi:hypothetical protein
VATGDNGVALVVLVVASTFERPGENRIQSMGANGISNYC